MGSSMKLYCSCCHLSGNAHPPQQGNQRDRGHCTVFFIRLSVLNKLYIEIVHKHSNPYKTPPTEWRHNILFNLITSLWKAEFDAQYLCTRPKVVFVHSVQFVAQVLNVFPAALTTSDSALKLTSPSLSICCSSCLAKASIVKLLSPVQDLMNVLDK